MSKKPLQTTAKQALDDYQKETDYLTLRTRQQLHLIRRAVVCQIAKELPQTKQYKGLLDNVDNQIAFRQKREEKKQWLTDLFRSEKQHRKQHEHNSSGRNLFQWLWEAFQHTSRDKTIESGHGGDISSSDQQSPLAQDSQYSSSVTANVPNNSKTKKRKDQQRKVKQT